MAARATKKGSTKKASAEENGAKATRTDKLAHLSESQRRKVAAYITKERSKSPATSWPDIMEVLEERGTPIPGSLTGRRLIRDYGPDGAEDAIIRQTRDGSSKKATKKPAKKAPEPEPEEDEAYDDMTMAELKELVEERELEVNGKATKAKLIKVLEEDDEEEDEEDDIEDEADLDDEDDEDEDDEEDEQPKRRRVRVKTGRGKKSNPSA